MGHAHLDHQKVIKREFERHWFSVIQTAGRVAGVVYLKIALFLHAQTHVYTHKRVGTITLLVQQELQNLLKVELLWGRFSRVSFGHVTHQEGWGSDSLIDRLV